MKRTLSKFISVILVLPIFCVQLLFAAQAERPLWTGGAVPKTSELSFPAGIVRRPITPSEPGKNLPPGWIKGVDVVWHKGVLYAAFGSNQKFKEQGENSPGEAAVYLTSRDAGKTWSEVRDIARGDGSMGISHGVFLSHQDRLWFFCGAFEGKRKKLHTLAYLLDEARGVWVPKGQILGEGFWPLQKPMKLPDGNWIMSGIRVGNGAPAAVAISHGEDLMSWNLVVIPQPEGLGTMWGESSLIRDGDRLINIARYGAEAVALMAESMDEGRTWSPSTPSNLPMTTSKPYSGILHSGQPYLVCTTTADAGTKRNPLTIAVGKPSGHGLSRVFALDTEGGMMYPGCDEYEGHLYIGYTRGFVPQLAVVPVASFAVEDSQAAPTQVKPDPLERLTRVAEVPVWNSQMPVPPSGGLPVPKDLRFNVIKPYEFQKDGYRFLHGVALCFHKGRLYASFGHNQGGENTDTEEARFCVSDDDGRTWSAVRTIDAGEGPVGVSHGAFLSHNGNLWAFQGAYTRIMHGVHTRAYLLDEQTQRWLPKGTVIEAGFWPMQEPQKMDDGNWIMAGLQVGGQNPAAVAISRGEDFTRWDVVSIPPGPSVKKMWGESAILVQGREVTSISRYGERAQALVARSLDYGRTWEPMQPSNLPMTTSKPSAGILSSGQRYLVCTTTADSGQRRAPLTLAVSRPGEKEFSKVFVIRHAVMEGTEAESHPNAALSYPYVVERGGNLYVGYSNTGGKVGRVGTGRELWNNNSAELAVIPVRSLAVDGDNGASLASRGLPRILFNNDSDDLKWPAYPEHHANGLWVPAGKYLPLPTIHSLDDALAPRIGPLAKTKTQGLSYCGNFGLPIWELKRDHIAALGDDPLQPILQFWKRDGRTFFFSMRMNDAHHEIFNWAHLWDDFRRSHRDLWINPPTDDEWKTQFLPWLNGAGPKPEFPSRRDLRLDYSKLQVRKHYLDTLREVCRRYDIDGIELDWLRSPVLFRPQEVDAATITAFVAEARAILDAAAKTRGRPLRLLSRVPDSPKDALAIGLDVEAWLKKGLLDAVIAGNGVMFSSLDLEAWVALAHRHHTPVYGSLERMKIRKSFSRYGTPETLRAAAATLWEKGADGLYFFNFYLRDEMPMLDEFGDRAKLMDLPKEYFCDKLVTLKPGDLATVHLVIADDPAKTKEATLEVLFKSEGEIQAPVITLNGQPLEELKSTPANAGFTLTLSSAALKAALKRGVNEFTLTAQKAATVTALSVRVLP